MEADSLVFSSDRNAISLYRPEQSRQQTRWCGTQVTAVGPRLISRTSLVIRPIVSLLHCQSRTRLYSLLGRYPLRAALFEAHDLRFDSSPDA